MERRITISDMEEVPGQEDISEEEASSLEDVQVKDMNGLEDAPMEEVPGLEDVPVKEIRGLEDAPMEEVPGLEDAPIEDLSVLEDVPIKEEVSGLEKIADVALRVLVKYLSKQDIASLSAVSPRMYENVTSSLKKYRRGIWRLDFSGQSFDQVSEVLQKSPMLNRLPSHNSEKKLFLVVNMNEDDLSSYQPFVNRFKGRITGQEVWLDHTTFDYLSAADDENEGADQILMPCLTKLHINSEFTYCYDVTGIDDDLPTLSFLWLMMRFYSVSVTYIKKLILENASTLKEVYVFESNIVGLEEIKDGESEGSNIEKLKLLGDCGLSASDYTEAKRAAWYTEFGETLKTGFKNLLIYSSQSLVELILEYTSLHIYSNSDLEFEFENLKRLEVTDCDFNVNILTSLLKASKSSLEEFQLTVMDIEGLVRLDLVMSKLKKLHIESTSDSDGAGITALIYTCSNTLEELNIVSHHTPIDQLRITAALPMLKRLRIDVNDYTRFDVLKPLLCAASGSLEYININDNVGLAGFNMNGQVFQRLSDVVLERNDATGARLMLLASAAGLKTLTCRHMPHLQIPSNALCNLTTLKFSYQSEVGTIRNLMLASSSSLTFVEFNKVDVTELKLPASTMTSLVQVVLKDCSGHLATLRNIITASNNLLSLQLYRSCTAIDPEILRSENPNMRIVYCTASEYDWMMWD